MTNKCCNDGFEVLLSKISGDVTRQNRAF